MVAQHKENFVSWDNITEFIDINDSQVVTNSDPCFWDDALPAETRIAGVRTTTLPGVFSGSDEIILYGRVKCLYGIGAGAGIWLYDGTTYVGMHPIFTASGFFLGVAGTNSTTSKITNTTSDDTEKSYWTFNEWFWMRIIIDGTSVRFYYLNSNSPVKPNDDDWLEATAIAITLGGALGTITQIGGVFSEVIGNMSDSFIDDLEIIKGAGITIENSVFDGEIIQIYDTYVRSAIGESGSFAKFKVYDPFDDYITEMDSARGTVVTMSETYFNQRLFQGEIMETSKISKEVVANGIEAKLATTKANTDPVVFRGEVEMLVGNILYKQAYGAGASPAYPGSYADKFIVFVKIDKKLITNFANDIYLENRTTGAETTPDSTTGSISNTFFTLPENKGYTVEQGFFATYDDNVAFHDHVVEFVPLVKNGSTIETYQIDIIVDFGDFVWHPNAGSNSLYRPFISIWNYTTAAWVKLTDFSKSQTGLQSRTYKFPEDLPAGVLADFYSVGANNNYNWKPTTFKIAIHGITKETAGGVRVHRSQVNYAKIVLTTDIEQLSEVGVGQIKTVADHALTLYSGAERSWLDEDVKNDGIGVSEVMLFSGSQEDIITDIWVNSGMDQILTLDFDSSISNYPDIDDMRYTYIREVIKKWSTMHNAADWIDYTVDPLTTLPTFRFKVSFDDCLDGSGSVLVVTDIDIPDWRELVTYRQNAEHEKENIYVLGTDGLVSADTNVTEDTKTLGGEDLIIRNPSLETILQTKRYVEKRKLLYRDAEVICSFPLFLVRANQDYSGINKGKYIQLKFPADGSVINHTTGNDGKLFIDQVEWQRNAKTGGKDMLIVSCHKRVIS